MSVYERVEAMIRERLAGRRGDFRERCVRLGLWLVRRHGPYGRAKFGVPPKELGKDKKREDRGDEQFIRQVGLTYSQIRTAVQALIEAGLLERTSPLRQQRYRKDPPTEFKLGSTFAILFPVAQSAAARAAAQYKVARSAPNLSRNLKAGRIQNKAPLTVASCDDLSKNERDLALARLAALRTQPIPMLSAGILRGFSVPK